MTDNNFNRENSVQTKSVCIRHGDDEFLFCLSNDLFEDDCIPESRNDNSGDLFVNTEDSSSDVFGAAPRQQFDVGGSESFAAAEFLPNDVHHRDYWRLPADHDNLVQGLVNQDNVQEHLGLHYLNQDDILMSGMDYFSTEQAIYNAIDANNNVNIAANNDLATTDTIYSEHDVQQDSTSGTTNADHTGTVEVTQVEYETKMEDSNPLYLDFDFNPEEDEGTSNQLQFNYQLPTENGCFGNYIEYEYEGKKTYTTYFNNANESNMYSHYKPMGRKTSKTAGKRSSPQIKQPKTENYMMAVPNETWSVPSFLNATEPEIIIRAPPKRTKDSVRLERQLAEQASLEMEAGIDNKVLDANNVATVVPSDGPGDGPSDIPNDVPSTVPNDVPIYVSVDISSDTSRTSAANKQSRKQTFDKIRMGADDFSFVVHDNDDNDEWNKSFSNSIPDLLPIKIIDKNANELVTKVPARSGKRLFEKMSTNSRAPKMKRYQNKHYGSDYFDDCDSDDDDGTDDYAYEDRSDSDYEVDNRYNNKSLKCFHCQKLFKAHKSLVIHKKNWKCPNRNGRKSGTGMGRVSKIEISTGSNDMAGGKGECIQKYQQEQPQQKDVEIPVKSKNDDNRETKIGSTEPPMKECSINLPILQQTRRKRSSKQSSMKSDETVEIVNTVTGVNSRKLSLRNTTKSLSYTK